MTTFTNEEAEQLWFGRWNGEKVHKLASQFGENTFRLYEVWSEEKNEGTRVQAWEKFQKSFPERAKQIDPSPHRQRYRIDKKLCLENQLDLFKKQKKH